MTSWHAERAWLGRVGRDVLIEVEGDRIVSVTEGVAPSAGVVRLPGVVLPGLVNGHSHAFHRALRGRTHSGVGDFWTWRDAMYGLAERLDPDRYLELATAVYAEMALAGITAVGEFHYLHHAEGGHPYSSPNAMGEALVEAARSAGIRITLLDTCYLRAGARGEPLVGTQARFSDGDVDSWAKRAGDRTPSEGAVMGAAIHSVRAVDPESMTSAAEWAEARTAPLHLHLSEQRAENEACVAETGMTPAELAADRRVLGPSTTVVHATHVNPLDVELLGRSRTSVCMCPTTERDLGDGIGPASAFVDAGSPLCLGTDSHALIDLFEEARAVELDERLATGRRGLNAPEDLLEAATRHGAKALGWDSGWLEPGAPADFIAVDMDSVRTAGAAPETLPANVVFAAAPADVTHVVVGGRTIVEDRHHVAMDDPGAALARAVKPLFEP